VRFRVIIAGLFAALALAAQAVDPAPGPDVYRVFFQEALANKDSTTGTVPVVVNGQATELTSISIQDAIGITDREAQSVVEASTGCEAEITSLENAARAMVFESRLRAANEEKPGDVEDRLKALDVKRLEIIMEHVQRMKVSLGVERFMRVDDFIRAHATGSFFPSTYPPGTFPRKL
jgi:hypothetical protein